MKLESKSTRTYRYQNCGEELIYRFLKACVVLNGLNKSFLHRESIEPQTNQATVSSKRTLNMLSLRQLSPGSHANKCLPRQRITGSSDSQLSRERLNLIKQGNCTHDQRLTSCSSLCSWPCFARKQQCPGCTSILSSAEWHIQITADFFSKSLAASKFRANDANSS